MDMDDAACLFADLGVGARVPDDPQERLLAQVGELVTGERGIALGMLEHGFQVPRIAPQLRPEQQVAQQPTVQAARSDGSSSTGRGE